MREFDGTIAFKGAAPTSASLYRGSVFQEELVITPAGPNFALSRKPGATPVAAGVFRIVMATSCGCREETVHVRCNLPAVPVPVKRAGTTPATDGGTTPVPTCP